MNQLRSPNRILIVDDEDNVRSVLLRHLQEEGSECVACPSALDALNKMKDQRFSLVISDVMMPGMSGMEFLRLVKKEDPETAFIMITGLMDINTAVDSLRIGACDFITKPFELTAIRRAVDRALERRRLLIENRYYREELERKVRARTLELNEALHDVEESYKITLEALVTALDAREHETKAHSQRVREYTLTLAQELGLRHDDLIQTGRGALLHDVGKIGVRDSILLKPGKIERRGMGGNAKASPDRLQYFAKHRIPFSCCRNCSVPPGAMGRIGISEQIGRGGYSTWCDNICGRRYDGCNDQRSSLPQSIISGSGDQ